MALAIGCGRSRSAVDCMSENLRVRPCFGTCGQVLRLSGRGRHTYEVAYSEGEHGRVFCRACTEALDRSAGATPNSDAARTAPLPTEAIPGARFHSLPAFVALLNGRLAELPPPKRSSRDERKERSLLEGLLARYRSRGISV